MNNKEEILNKEESFEYSIHDVSQRLSIPENTLRKYLAYFDLKVERIGRKNYLSEDVIQCLSEILQLKSNSWSLKQIKSFREAQKSKSTQVEKENDKDEEVFNQNNLSHIEEDAESSIKVIENNIQSSTQIPENYLIEEKPEQEESNSINLPEQQIIKEAQEIIEKTDQDDFQTDSEETEQNQFKEENHNAEETNNQELEKEIDDSNDPESRKNKRIITIPNKPPLTKDYVNKEIATQAKRASRLYRFLGSRNSSKDSAEIKADLNRRVEFLNGLRYIRDNWLERQLSRISQ